MEGKQIYNIFHCKRLPGNPIPPHKVDREYAGSVWASGLDEAFQVSQNDFNPSWAKLGNRSTSVGDVIQDPEGKFHQVMNIGFEIFE